MMYLICVMNEVRRDELNAPKRITELLFSHPLANLRPSDGDREHEAKFTEAFARSYSDNVRRIHSRSGKTNVLMARELPVNGFGIADLITVTWNPSGGISEDGLSFVGVDDRKITVRVFEAKLTNWKKGLMQAHRYSYFADASILVFPASRISRAMSQMDTFYKLGVGLWSFNETTCSIRTIYTPRPRKPQVQKHRIIALQRILGSFTALRDV